MDRDQAYAVWKAILRRYGRNWDWHTFYVCHPTVEPVLRKAVYIATGR